MDPIRRVEELLVPGGELIGSPGTVKEIRNVPGGLVAAEEMFEELASLGEKVERPDYPGQTALLPVIGEIGFRPVSGRGRREPTIDVNAIVAGVEIQKLKFVESFIESSARE